MLQARRPQLVVVTGLGIPGNEAAAARAAVQLSALLPGNGGVLVLSEKANVQGLVDVGVHPHLLPGHRPASESWAGEEVAALTASRVAAGVGWTAREACDAAALGEVGALLLAGVDPVRTFPREYQGPAAVKGAGFVICLDAFLTDSARMADVVLPVALLAEREGSTIGLDGVRRRLRRALAPPVPLPGDGDLLRQLGARLGLEIPVGERLQDEMNRVVGWPHPPAVLRRLLPVPQPGARLGWSGILLDGSPHLFHSGSVTTRSAILRELAPPIALRLHPDDALELDVWRRRRGVGGQRRPRTPAPGEGRPHGASEHGRGAVGGRSPRSIGTDSKRIRASGRQASEIPVIERPDRGFQRVF